MGRILDHNNVMYQMRLLRAGKNRHNGAYYYAEEIKRNILPNVRTDRNWVLVNQQGMCMDHSIVFVHNNMHPQNYEWLSAYDDLVLVCGVYETQQKVKHLGKTIFLPLSVDVAQVMAHKRPKTKDRAFFGRLNKSKGIEFPEGTDIIEGLPRREFLARMAEYREVYAVGRTAIEAKILGCKVLPYDPRYPNPGRWKVLDNRDAAKMLQEKLDKLDGAWR